MSTIFDIAKAKGQVAPVLATIGVKISPAESWEATKPIIAKRATMALKKPNLRPENRTRWNAVAIMALGHIPANGHN